MGSVANGCFDSLRLAMQILPALSFTASCTFLSETIMAERRTSLTLLLIALAPCLVAVVAEAIPARPIDVPQSTPLPALAFSQYGVSYPHVEPMPVIAAPFEFTNRGSVPLTIEKLEPSCGCLRVHLARGQKTFAPGESGALLVQMHTANEQPGMHFYTIDVTARGAEEQREQLTFRVVLPERKITIEPAEVFFYQLSGEADSRTVYVTDHREATLTPLEVTTVQTVALGTDVPASLTAVALPPELDEQGHRRIPIVIEAPGNVPPGRHTEIVRIATNDPEFSQLTFPALVQGRTEVYGPPVDVDRLVDVFEIMQSRQAAADGALPR